MSAPGRAEAPPRMRAWLRAARPRTLGASLIPVAVGGALAHAEGALRPGVWAGCAAAALALQVGVNLANDAQDFLSGIDTGARRGPARATQAGWLPAGDVLRAAHACFALAAALGAWLAWVGGWPILAVGVLSIGAALGYSAGPFPLASHGLGELAAFAFFGVVAVTGSTYLHTQAISAAALAASVPIGCLAAALMAVNNLRDLETDRVAGKRTLAVRLGPRLTRAGYAALVAAAFAAAPLIAAATGRRLALLPWLALPLAALTVRALARARTGAAFNRALAGTARLHTVYGALLAAGIAA